MINKIKAMMLFCVCSGCFSVFGEVSQCLDIFTTHFCRKSASSYTDDKEAISAIATEFDKTPGPKEGYERALRIYVACKGDPKTIMNAVLGYGCNIRDAQFLLDCSALRKAYMEHVGKHFNKSSETCCFNRDIQYVTNEYINNSSNKFEVQIGGQCGKGNFDQLYGIYPDDNTKFADQSGLKLKAKAVNKGDLQTMTGFAEYIGFSFAIKKKDRGSLTEGTFCPASVKPF